MAITKSDVEDFINQKINDKSKEVQSLIDTTIVEKLNPILDGMFNDPLLEKVTRYSRNFTDILEKAIESYGLKSWDYQNTISMVNRYALPLKSRLINDLLNIASRYIRNPQSKAMDVNKDFRGNQALFDAVQELQQTCAPLYKKLNDLHTLKSELLHAVKVEPSGKRAYKAMLALGVNMEDFEDNQKAKGNLPAVIKLSVDVAILSA